MKVVIHSLRYKTQNVKRGLAKRKYVLRFKAVLRFTVPRFAKRQSPTKHNIDFRDIRVYFSKVTSLTFEFRTSFHLVRFRHSITLGG